jgi:hypothetical protein
VPDTFNEIVRRLRDSRFRDLSGTRLGATIPIAEDLLNQIIAATLPPNAPVRAVNLHPEDGDRLSVRISPKAALMPSITLKLAIEEQPRLPDSPVLVLRMATLSGLFGLASGAISGMLPPGVTLQGERIHVDLGILAAQQPGAEEWLDLLTQIEVHAEAGRLVVLLNAALP